VSAARGKSEREVTREVLQALAYFPIEIDRQNTGGMVGAGGGYVPFGRPGNSDYTGMFTGGHYRGCKLDLEIKREGFRPERARGASRERFLRQIERLERTNAQGGAGLWVSDAIQVFVVMPKLFRGARIVFDERGYPYTEMDG
jgi:hypothetical protein